MLRGGCTSTAQAPRPAHLSPVAAGGRGGRSACAPGRVPGPALSDAFARFAFSAVHTASAPVCLPRTGRGVRRLGGGGPALRLCASDLWAEAPFLLGVRLPGRGAVGSGPAVPKALGNGRPPPWQPQRPTLWAADSESEALTGHARDTAPSPWARPPLPRRAVWPGWRVAGPPSLPLTSAAASSLEKRLFKALVHF